jgi:hypothetical protein
VSVKKKSQSISIADKDNLLIANDEPFLLCGYQDQLERFF